jgi:ornithine cyclodeaminase/alanine dehydrogenase-like protein (mu-crystallin family)
MSDPHQIRYFSRAMLESSGLTGLDFVPALEEVFRLHAAGACLVPPHIYAPQPDGSFINGMMAWVPAWGFASGKLQMGDPANPGRGRPQVQGLLALFDHASALPVAIMEAGWVTALRSVGVSMMLASRHRPTSARVLGVIGAGLQARLHLQALAALPGGIERCVAYDIRPERAEAFAAWAAAAGLPPVAVAESAEAAVRPADILMSATVILRPKRPFIEAAWLKPDCLILALDRDCCFTDAAVAAADATISDDRAYFEHARDHEGAFQAVPHLHCDLAEWLSGRSTLPTEGRTMMLPIGLPISDLAGAVTAWRRLAQVGGTPSLMF